MNRDIWEGFFENNSQRAAATYLALLNEENPGGLETTRLQELPPEGAAMHAFLLQLYNELFLSPSAFGLPDEADLCITGSEPDPVAFKQQVKKRLDKPMRLIEHGMDFLLFIGLAASLQDDTLQIDKETYKKLHKDCKVKKQFIEGLEKVGLQSITRENTVILQNEKYPAMITGLKALAQACGHHANPKFGKFNFARAEWRALAENFEPSALDLFTFFDPTKFNLLVQLHCYLLDLTYQPLPVVYGIHGWEVQYQPPRKIKATPMVRIQFDPRYKDPLQVAVKCASVNRIVDLVYTQPRFLQEDFSRRVFTCRGEACNWCADKKGLAPSSYIFDGVTRKVCWYHKPEIETFDSQALQLIQQYAQMHQALAV